jgi:hypothetical protein
MRASEFIFEKMVNPTASQCQKQGLSNVRRGQCVSLGLKAHDSDHTAGTGKQGVKGSGEKLRGIKAKSVRHGGRVKDYGGPTRK